MNVEKIDKGLLAEEMNRLDRENREEIVWVQDINAMGTERTLEQNAEAGLKPQATLATIVRDSGGNLKNIILHHSGTYDGYYGTNEDYHKRKIKIENGMITGGMQGPLRIVGHGATPEQKWIARTSNQAAEEEQQKQKTE